MNRLTVIQKLLASTKARLYLEIGVRYGTIFLPIKATTKIAVDPDFRIPWYKRLVYFMNFINSRYFEMTSDDYFIRKGEWLKAHLVDVAFIDGLHTYAQSLKDVENCLKHLSPDGAIVMHDCYPPSAAAALLNMEDSIKAGSKAWCGDVWKTIVYLRSTRNDLDVCVLDTDYGLGIIRKGKPESMLAYSPSDIAALSYDDLARDPKNMLNLKPASYLEDILYAMRS